LSDAGVAEIQTVLVDTGALADLEATIVALTTEAIAAVREVDLTPDAIEALVALAEFVSQREI
jgi:geranylgeranyl pyrophosphate synthase